MNPVANTISGVYDPALEIVIHIESQGPTMWDFNGDWWVATFESLEGYGEVYQPDEDGDKTGMGWDGVPDFMRYDIYAFDVLSKNIQRITMLDGTGEYNPSFSPNGKKVAHDVVYWDSSHGIYITDIKTSVSVPLVGAEDGGNDAVWSPNGKWIAFDRYWVGDPNLYLVPAEGGMRMLVRNDAISADWAPSGKRLVFQQPSDGSIRTVSVDGGKGGETLIALNGANPVWSPDGNWIAYEKDGDIWKVRVNVQGVTFGDPIQVTSGPFNDGQPTWSADSLTIIYHSGFNADWDLWTIPASGGMGTWLNGALVFGDYDPSYAKNSSSVGYASFSPDGQAPRTWVSAYTYDAGTWDAGTHTYQFWIQGVPNSDEYSFDVSIENPPYDGFALIRPGTLRAQTMDGCANIGVIHPDQPTQFHVGWTFNGFYSDAWTFFANLMAQVRWDAEAPVNMIQHEVFPFTSGVDWFGYTCTFISP
jgi:Tol biopolymer transport system component